MSEEKKATDFQGQANIALSMLVADLYEVIATLPGVSTDELKARLRSIKNMSKRYGSFAPEFIETIGSIALGGIEEDDKNG